MPATPDPGFKSAISFTPAERTAHQQSAAAIADTAAKYLQAIWKEHVAFHRKHGFSKFYGDRNISLNTKAKRIAALRQIGASESMVDHSRGSEPSLGRLCGTTFFLIVAIHALILGSALLSAG